ncbi:MAG: PAS domain S-box protein [Pseudomonadales bacterium]|nr:PAS domain S-box protein [Pseudomonadales bacterium]
MSLRFRVNIAILLIGIVCMAAMAYMLIDYKRKSTDQEIEAGTRVAIQLLQSVLQSPVYSADASDPLVSLTQYLGNVGRVRANEVRLFDQEGTLIYESPPSEYKEGRSAPAWFSRLIAPDIGEVRLALAGGSILITPDSSRSVLDAWDELERFALFLLSFFLLLSVAVFRILGRTLQPLKDIVSAMSQMEQGKYQVRLKNYRDLPEINAISQTFNRMASSLEEALAQNARLALIAQQSSDAIMIRDPDGIISFCNQAVERLSGYRIDEIIGSDAGLILESACSAPSLHDASKTVVEHMETRVTTKQGKLVEVALSTTPLIDPTSKLTLGKIYVIRDMTEHKQRMAAELELEQSRKLTQLIQVKLEEERKAIARELHDELGQCVTAIRTIGTTIAKRASNEHDETRQNAQTIVEVATHIYDVVHSMIRQLRPSALDHLGLSDAISELVLQYRHQHPQLSVELVLGNDLNQFDEKLNIAIYRVVQECLTNVVKHAAASHVTVSLVLKQEILKQKVLKKLEIRVSDDGKGLGMEFSERARFGILGIKERIQAFGGEVLCESNPDGGTSMLATLPIATDNS